MCLFLGFLVPFRKAYKPNLKKNYPVYAKVKYDVTIRTRSSSDDHDDREMIMIRYL